MNPTIAAKNWREIPELAVVPDDFMPGGDIAHRLPRAKRALTAYIDEDPVNDQSIIADCITDLLHLAVFLGIDPDSVLGSVASNLDEEVGRCNEIEGFYILVFSDPQGNEFPQDHPEAHFAGSFEDCVRHVRKSSNILTNATCYFRSNGLTMREDINLDERVRLGLSPYSDQ